MQMRVSRRAAETQREDKEIKGAKKFEGILFFVLIMSRFVQESWSRALARSRSKRGGDAVCSFLERLREYVLCAARYRYRVQIVGARTIF
jgi:hypothetical protein